MAQRLVSALERPRSMPEIFRALGRERWKAVKPHSLMTTAGQLSDTHRPPSTRASGSYSLKVTETCSLGVGLEWLLLKSPGKAVQHNGWRAGQDQT